MIIKTNLLISTFEVEEPLEGEVPSIKNMGKEVAIFPITVSDIKTWYFSDNTIKVVAPNYFDMQGQGNSVFELDHTLEEFENLMRESLRGKGKLLSKREVEILEYLVRNNDYSIQGDMFEG